MSHIDPSNPISTDAALGSATFISSFSLHPIFLRVVATVCSSSVSLSHKQAVVILSKLKFAGSSLTTSQWWLWWCTMSKIHHNNHLSSPKVYFLNWTVEMEIFIQLMGEMGEQKYEQWRHFLSDAPLGRSGVNASLACPKLVSFTNNYFCSSCLKLVSFPYPQFLRFVKCSVVKTSQVQWMFLASSNIFAQWPCLTLL